MESLVAVGNKSVYPYVLAARKAFETSNAIAIVARGKNMSKAIDVALFLAERPNSDRVKYRVESIGIKTEKFQTMSDQTLEEKRVSAIRIDLKAEKVRN